MNIVFARFYHSYVLELCKNLALPLFIVSSSSKLHKKCFLLLITYSPIPLFHAKQKWIIRWDRSTQNYNLWVCLKPNKTNSCLQCMQTMQRHLDRSTYTKGNRELEITEKQTKIRKRQGRWVIARSDAIVSSFNIVYTLKGALSWRL